MCVVRKSGGNIISFYIEESRVICSLFYYFLFVNKNKNIYIVSKPI
nr:MAG TPA: hypothetical protein [Bacteriophage sp.]